MWGRDATAHEAAGERREGDQGAGERGEGGGGWDGGAAPVWEDGAEGGTEGPPLPCGSLERGRGEPGQPPEESFRTSSDPRAVGNREVGACPGQGDSGGGGLSRGD